LFQVASETGATETIICEIFLEVNGECPAEEHCVVETRIPACVYVKYFDITYICMPYESWKAFFLKIIWKFIELCETVYFRFSVTVIYRILTPK
jgi:hypothetical protein